jgi:hypothetical protein
MTAQACLEYCKILEDLAHAAFNPLRETRAVDDLLNWHIKQKLSILGVLKPSLEALYGLSDRNLAEARSLACLVLSAEALGALEDMWGPDIIIWSYCNAPPEWRVRAQAYLDAAEINPKILLSAYYYLTDLQPIEKSLACLDLNYRLIEGLRGFAFTPELVSTLIAAH